MIRLVGALAAICTGLLCAASGSASPEPRIASLNACTDELLLALAEPGQIVGIRPVRRRSTELAGRTAGFRVLSGGAEDILELRPDVVVASSFDSRETRDLLQAHGIRVETFAPVTSASDAQAQLARMAALVGHPERAAAFIAAIHRAELRLRASAKRPLRVLALDRGGWVAGGQSLIGSMMSTAGLIDAGRGLQASGRYLSLERILQLRPDRLLVTSGSERANDQGVALLLHPALEHFYPTAERILVPAQLTLCGGPRTAEALDRLAAEIRRIEP